MQAEAQEFISSCDCPTYLLHAKRRLDEEAERVQNYLDLGSEPRVIKVCTTAEHFKCLAGDVICPCAPAALNVSLSWPLLLSMSSSSCCISLHVL